MRKWNLPRAEKGVKQTYAKEPENSQRNVSSVSCTARFLQLCFPMSNWFDNRNGQGSTLDQNDESRWFDTRQLKQDDQSRWLDDRSGDGSLLNQDWQYSSFTPASSTPNANWFDRV